MQTRFVVVVVIAMLGTSLWGCNSQPPQAAVQGQVTFNGSPVDGGQIRFIPSGEGGTPAEAMLEGGKYEIPAAKGPSVGKHVVEIRWSRKTGKKINAPPLGEVDETRQVIPSTYNDQSTLACEIKPGTNEYNADLKSK